MKTKDLEDINGIKAEIDYEEIVKKYANETKEKLISPAVSPHSDRPNRTTPYRLGWIVTEKSNKGMLRDTVWNETNWQLTHLLENGHFITNHGALAWSAPRKHIKPTYDTMKPKFIDAMKKAKVIVDFK